MKIVCLVILIAIAIAQNAGNQKSEYHIPFPYS